MNYNNAIDFKETHSQNYTGTTNPVNYKKKIYTELRETHLQNQSTNNRKPNASRQKCY